MSNKVLNAINPDTDYRILLIRESSNIVLSRWISQMQDDGMIRPATFHSKKFKNAQMHYAIANKEFRDIVDTVRHFTGGLQGDLITILTDHQILVAFMSCLQTNHMMIRWQESLS